MTGNVHSNEAASRPETKKRKKRRWLRWLIIILVILFVLLIAAPSLMSTGLGRNLVVSIANDSLRGRVEIESLSLGWFGPISVTGVKLFDQQGRAVLDVPSLSCEMGLWGVIFSPGRFESLTIDKPRVDIYLEQDGRMSLTEALPEPSKEKPQAGPSEFDIMGKISLSDATVRVVKPTGPELTIHNIETDLTVDWPKNISGTTSLGINNGGQVEIVTLVTDQTTLELSIATKAPIDIKPICEFLELATLPEGMLSIKTTGSLSENSQTVIGVIDITDFRSSAAEEPALPKMTLNLATEMNATPEKMIGKITLNSQPANLTGQLACDDIKALTKITQDQWLDAILHGQPLPLPIATLDVKGQADIAAVTKSFPQLAGLSRQTTVKTGRAVISIAAKTKPAPNVVANLKVVELTGQRINSADSQVRPFEFQPIGFALQADIHDKVGLNIEALKLQTQAGGLVGGGTASKFAMNMRFDLARLRDMVNQLAESEVKNLAGMIDAKFQVSETSKGEYGLAMVLEGKDILLPAGEKTARFDTFNATLPAAVSVQKTTVTKATLKNATVTINGHAPVSLAGSYEESADKRSFAVLLKQLELGDLDAVLQTLGIETLKDYRGSVDVSAQARMDTQAETTSLNADANIENLRVSDQPVNNQDAPLSFHAKNLVYNAATQDVSLKNLTATQGSDLNVKIDDLVYRTGQVPQANGQVALMTDLAYIRRLIAPMLEPDQMKDLAGQLAYKCTLDMAGDNLDMKGRGNISGFVIEKSQADWGDIAFMHSLQLDTKADLLKIGDLQLSSRALNLQLTPPNTIADLRGEKILAIQGRFNGSWPSLIQLAENFIPALKKDLALDLQGELAANTGMNSCEFTLTGPVNNPKLNPTFKSVRSQTAFGWTSGKLLGLEIGGAKFVPDMKDGRLTFGKPSIPASGGTINLDGAIDFMPGGMVFNLPGRVAIIDNVMINPEVGELLLSRFNPLFAKAVQLEGEMTLMVEDMYVPFGDEFKTHGRGRGKLDLSKLKISPGKGGLSKIFEMAGKRTTSDSAYPVRTTGVDFEIKQGRINYENFTLILGNNFDLIFSGWVGFDDTMELIASVPIRAGVLSAFNVAGPVADYARVMEKSGVRIKIPISGTRKMPSLDLGKVDIKPFVEAAVKALLKEKLTGGSPLMPNATGAEKNHGEKVQDPVSDLLKKSMQELLKPKTQEPAKNQN